jgi:hypothetical protein
MESPAVPPCLPSTLVAAPELVPPDQLVSRPIEHHIALAYLDAVGGIPRQRENPNGRIPLADGPVIGYGMHCLTR